MERQGGPITIPVGKDDTREKAAQFNLMKNHIINRLSRDSFPQCQLHLFLHHELYLPESPSVPGYFYLFASLLSSEPDFSISPGNDHGAGRNSLHDTLAQRPLGVESLPGYRKSTPELLFSGGVPSSILLNIIFINVIPTPTGIGSRHISAPLAGGYFRTGVAGGGASNLL